MNQVSNNLKTDMSVKKFSMLRVIKRTAILGLLALSVQLSHGFALLGPFETYQIPAIGYAWDSYFQGVPGGVVGYSGQGGPHNIGEEFRRNTPVMYYACDGNFLEFFGSNGVAAVDQAFAILNSLTNVSLYTPDLLEFPLEAQRINPLARNMALTDVKSLTLHVLVQQLGLDQPEHYVWTLRNRIMGSPCPGTGQYVVIMRNFGITPSIPQQLQYSPYVNGVLYSYGIVENCGTALLAYTDPFAVDPNAETYTTIASEPAFLGTGEGTLANLNIGGVGLHVGGYYTYLTRDDVAGLRYLLSKDNYNVESSGPDTVQFVTNAISPTPLPTFDLGLLASLAATNTAAQLQAIFPGLVDTETLVGFALLTNRDVSLVITNPPYAPAGTFTTMFVTNTTVTFTPLYSHTFDNVITNQFSGRSLITYQTISLKAPPFSPAGSAVTNITTKSVVTNAVAGEFYLVPTNLCGVVLLTNVLNLPNVIATTNSILATNAVGGTVSNLTGVIAQNVITYFTNHAIAYRPLTCPADTVALRQGIERIQFIRRDFDSLIGRFWMPATNTYTMVELTNSSLRSQVIQRVVTQPDFLFTADDIQPGVQSPLYADETLRRSAMNFVQVSSNGLAGPGTIQSPSTFTYNKLGAQNFNYFGANFGNGWFVSDQSTAIQGLLWASFDGTTNEPVVYPNGTSITNLINQLVIQVQPMSLADATGGVPYSVTFTATGGQAPFTWSISAGSLPAGITLSAAGVLSGTPTLPGALSAIYDFTVRATDAAGRVVETPLSLTINP